MNQVTNSLINLLVKIIINQLKLNLNQSALFFSERLHQLIPSSELSIWLLSLSLIKSNQHQATVHLLKNTPVYLISNSNSNQNKNEFQLNNKNLDPFHSHPPNQKNKINQNSSSNNLNPIQRPAYSASTRCALVYSQACSFINRPKEGLDIYLKAIDQFGIPSPDEIALLQPLSNLDQSASSTYTQIANLAYKSHEYEKASQFYRKALEASPHGHLCWEAFEGLCQTIGTDEQIDINQIFSSIDPNQYLAGYMELDDHYILCTPNASTSSNQTPSSIPIASNAPIKPHPPPLAPKDAFRILGTNALHLHKSSLLDHSFGESSQSSSFVVNSFDRPPYLPNKHNHSSHRPTHQLKLNLINYHGAKAEIASTPNLNRPSRLPPKSFNFSAIGESPQPNSGFDPHPPISSTPNLRHGFPLDHNHQFSSPPNPNPLPPMPAPSPIPSFNTFSSLNNNNKSPPAHHLTPLPPLSLAQQPQSQAAPTRTGLGGSAKRTRSQTQSQDLSRNSSEPATTSTSTELLVGQSTNTSAEPRDSKMSEDPIQPIEDENQIGKPSLVPSSSKREVIANGRLLKVGPRSTKRVKSDTKFIDHPPTPNLESRTNNLNKLKVDNNNNNRTSHHLSSTTQLFFKQDKLDAIEWLKNVLTQFGKAYFALSGFHSTLVLDAINSLPQEQKKSWRAFCLVGRAKFEMLDYKSAEIAFRKARESFPHLVQYMDIYSTLLWHLRKTTELSYLSQELQMIDPGAAETWIATGNLFSRLEGHANALKCFQRATQVSPTGTYGYTLSGHECLILEEYSRSENFFRESIRKNNIKKNYNGFFGLGECYFKQDRFKLSIFYFNLAFKINSNNPLILASLAKVFEAIGNLNLALNLYNHAISIASFDLASVRFSRAKVLFDLGQFEESKEDLIKLIEVVPTEFNIRFLLGKIYIKLGDKNLAIKHLTFAIDLEPNCLNQIKKILNSITLSELPSNSTSTVNPNPQSTSHTDLSQS